MENENADDDSSTSASKIKSAGMLDLGRGRWATGGSVLAEIMGKSTILCVEEMDAGRTSVTGGGGGG